MPKGVNLDIRRLLNIVLKINGLFSPLEVFLRAIDAFVSMIDPIIDLLKEAIKALGPIDCFQKFGPVQEANKAVDKCTELVDEALWEGVKTALKPIVDVVKGLLGGTSAYSTGLPSFSFKVGTRAEITAGFKSIGKPASCNLALWDRLQKLCLSGTYAFSFNTRASHLKINFEPIGTFEETKVDEAVLNWCKCCRRHRHIFP